MGDLLRQLERMGVPLASAWPVFVYRDFKKRRDFNLKFEEVKNFLMRVEELKIEFHSVLGELTVGFDLADTAVLELADREPLIILF